MERLPIKFFSKREEDEMRVEGGGGGELPKFVLQGDSLVDHATNLQGQFDGLLENATGKFSKNKPSVICAKMNPDAHAKSHRNKIETLFAGGGQPNIIGLVDEETLLVRIPNEKVAEAIKKRLETPSKFAYELSCVDSIEQYAATVVYDKGKANYKVKLIDLQDYASNVAYARKFEEDLKSANISFEKTAYTKELTVYKLIGVNTDELSKLKDSDLFDLTLEVTPMPKIWVEIDSLSSSKRIAVKSPIDDETTTIVGVLDNGICNIPELTPWLAGRSTSYPSTVISETHGTKVASIITYGDELIGETIVSAKNLMVFDATVYPDTNKESLEEDDLIRNIQEAVRAKASEIKVWNLSLSIAREISDNKFSDFAVALDALQDECGVLICKSAGNCRNFVKGKPIGRIQEGGDSVRSLVVGSLAKDHDSNCLSEADNPSPFSRIGPGPAYIVKPDLVSYGGNAGVTPYGDILESGNEVFDKAGNIVRSSGTSFSTPRVTALAAGLYNAMEEEFDSLLLKALMIHSASYPLNIEMPINERTKYVGFGKPSSVSDILYNSPNEATLILRDTLPKGQFIDIKDFPMPNCLCEGGFFRGQVIATLVYDPILEASQGFEYCQSNMNVRFGSYDRKLPRDTEKRNILNPVGRDGAKNLLLESLYSKQKMARNQQDFAKMERLLIQYGDKYYPVKKYAVDFSELTDGNKIKYLSADKEWFLTIDGVYRHYSEQKAALYGRELSQEFCLVLTIRDPEGRANVYDGVTQRLDELNFWHSSIKISSSVSIHA